MKARFLVVTEDGCAPRIVASALTGGRKWTRAFRWGDIAWTGSGPAGRIVVVFYESDGKLAGDTLAFAPPDAATFRAALGRMATACRSARGADERILASTQREVKSCYFGRFPQLQLEDGGAGRAVLTILSRENPQTNLELILDRAGSGGDDDWGDPSVAFVFADPQLRSIRIAGAAFELDGAAVPADHAIAAFGETRLRITMNPFRGGPVGGKGAGSFYRRLSASGVATLSLLGDDKATRAALHFDAGPMLAAGRSAGPGLALAA
jgi:hypothetical protein